MAKKIAPIKPSEVAAQRLNDMPEAVIETFNELIAKNCAGGFGTLLQKDVVKALVAKGLNRSDIFNNHWLDVEEIYWKAGWDVTYDRPGYCESYEPNFTFTARR
jgi:hypothetical protein